MFIKQTNSTSSLLRVQYTDDLPNLYTIRTDYQTAGRGQTGNGWESADGENLLFSFLLRPDNLLAAAQFTLTMRVSVAMWQTLAHYIDPRRLTIKWPNDMYYEDNKLAGILVENTLVGDRVAYSIVGIGLNVHQTRWSGTAPNPISLRQITDKQYDIEQLLAEYQSNLQALLTLPADEVRARYLEHLYRREGYHPYIEREVSTAPTRIARADQLTTPPFQAKFVDISPVGELVLCTEEGEERRYHFKQIRYVL